MSATMRCAAHKPCSALRPRACRQRLSVRASAVATRSAVQPDTSRAAATVTQLVPVDDPYYWHAPLEEHRAGGTNLPLLAGAAVVAGFILSRLRRRRSTPNSYEYYTPGRNDPFMSDVMTNVNTVAMDELSPDIIAAARARRSRERANHRVKLEDVELPDNHPFAVKKPVSQEQDAIIAERLAVRPRRAAGTAGPAAGGRTRLRQQQAPQEKY